MAILLDPGFGQVLTPYSELKEQLLRIEEAGRTCYQSGSKSEHSQESAQKFIRMLIKKGHESVLEHSCLTVRFLNTSRGFSAELNRHRLLAISQESTRYVDYTEVGSDPDEDTDPVQPQCDIRFVLPPKKIPNYPIELATQHPAAKFISRRSLTPEEMVSIYELFYQTLREADWRPEDARQFLPLGVKSELVVSANFREWRHIFALRCGRPAHWEIRRVMTDLLERCQQMVPGVFDDFKLKGFCERGIPIWEKKEKNG